jgi:hypothetical protein
MAAEAAVDLPLGNTLEKYREFTELKKKKRKENLAMLEM